MGFIENWSHRSVWYGECFVDLKLSSAERMDLDDEAAGETDLG